MASRTYRFLSSNQVQRLYVTLIANASSTQPGLLDSAVTSPMNVKYYGGQQNLFQLAAILSEKIIKNHTFQNGNKRAASVAADMFLKINGYLLQRTPLANDANNKDLANAYVRVATNQWSAKELGRYYETVATPVDE